LFHDGFVYDFDGMLWTFGDYGIKFNGFIDKGLFDQRPVFSRSAYRGFWVDNDQPFMICFGHKISFSRVKDRN
jgi:hypothetical protein